MLLKKDFFKIEQGKKTIPKFEVNRNVIFSATQRNYSRTPVER